MTNRRACLAPTTAVLLLSAALAGCDKDSSVPLAPAASALQPAKPAPAASVKLEIESASSKVDFLMDAPLEKIRGRAHGSTTGTLHVDPTDITKTRGLLRVAINGLELLQKVADDDGEFGAESKSEVQNQHARAWLEIGDDAPPEVREKNRVVEFRINRVDAPSARDLTKLGGVERALTATVTGDFRLHGRQSQKSAQVKVTFNFDREQLKSASFRTVKPFLVGLAEHDVRPREAFGKLAQRTLEMVAPKVAKEAAVTFELTAKIK